ncbi:MAG: PilZ domain-containing protein [Candidatus Omnitrophica bacterium]|nr:PilZ domain-containing protein [Candidatus Omnitrophota bacterium]
MIERRKYTRYPVHYDVYYRNIKDSSSKKNHAIVENVSRTGFKLRLPKLLQKNTDLELNIYKSIDSKPISAHGKVIWGKESPLVYGEKWAGIYFTKIGWTESAKLVNGKA